MSPGAAVGCRATSWMRPAPPSFEVRGCQPQRGRIVKMTNLETVRNTSSAKMPVIARLTLAEIEARILEIRRLAARQHVSQAEWRTVDRMRKRANALRKQ